MTSFNPILAILKSALLLAGALLCPDARAQTDSLFLDLEESAITVARRTASFTGRPGEGLAWDLSTGASPVSMLGLADPVHAATMIPGVATGIDIDSGLHIDGFDSMHNLISVDGVPIYGPGHLFGFFPIFNMTNHSTMTVSPFAEHANRLGGSLDLALDKEVPDKTTVAMDICTLAIDGSAAIRISDDAAFLISGRHSFLSSLYNKKLRIEDMPMDYSMDDVNMTFVMTPGETDIVWVDAFFSNDALFLDDVLTYGASVGSEWRNGFAALHWKHSTDRLSMDHTAYYSATSSRTTIDAMDMSLVLPDSFSSIAYSGKVDWGNIFSGIDIKFHRATVQMPETSGITYDDTYGMVAEERLGTGKNQAALEATLMAGYRLCLGRNLSANVDADFHCYRRAGEEPCFSASPSVLLRYDLHRAGTISLRAYMKNQFLFKNGLSNIGLPMEFWHLAGGELEPQLALGVILSHKVPLAHDTFSLASDLHLSRLRNQLEYTGTIYDLTAVSYNLDDFLMKGDGVNFGMNLRLEKNSGRITGWIGGALGRSLRRFDCQGLEGWYPANHERIFELNATATCLFGRFRPCASFVWATGTPFTAPDSFYILAGHLVSHYGEHNSCRLRPYSRMDVSCAIDLKGGARFKHGLNLAIYNVLCRKNDIFYHLKYDGSQISYKPSRYRMTFIPSISYRCEF